MTQGERTGKYFFFSDMRLVLPSSGVSPRLRLSRFSCLHDWLAAKGSFKEAGLDVRQETKWRNDNVCMTDFAEAGEVCNAGHSRLFFTLSLP